MSVQVENPFNDNKLWNNTIASNILSKLPTDLVNHVCKFIPKPMFSKTQEFKKGLYIRKLVKVITTKLPFVYTPIVKCRDTNRIITVEKRQPMIRQIIYRLEYVENQKETPKQFRIMENGKTLKSIYSKSDFIHDFGSYKRHKNFMDTFYFTDEFNGMYVDYITNSQKEDVLLPWLEYYNDEVKPIDKTDFEFDNTYEYIKIE